MRAPNETQPASALRLDKWLWQARIYKTRGLAAKAVRGGAIRLNGQRVRKPGHAVAVGDTLTLVVADRVRVLRLAALGARRGPAPEAQALYLDLGDPPPGDARPGAATGPGPDHSSQG